MSQQILRCLDAMFATLLFLWFVSILLIVLHRLKSRLTEVDLHLLRGVMI